MDDNTVGPLSSDFFSVKNTVSIFENYAVKPEKTGTDNTGRFVRSHNSIIFLEKILGQPDLEETGNRIIVPS